MAHPFPNFPPDQRGRIEAISLHSELLKRNPWNDPAVRDLWVYTPRAYVDDPGRRFPVVLVLPAFTSTGESMLGRSLFEPSLGTRFDRLIADGCPPFVAVLPDCMTSLVGSQFVDSPAIGPYASWLLDEVIPFVDERFRTTRRWAACGKSSGGFGALHLALTRPGAFAAVASHAGDMGFDLSYVGELFSAHAPLRGASDALTYAREWWSMARRGPEDFAAINLLCMSAAYDPLPAEAVEAALAAGRFPARLPLDAAAGTVDLEAFAAWQAFDPLARVREPAGQQALAGLDLLWIDAGDRDEYHLQMGARRLAGVLTDAGVPHHHEEFSGTHRGITHRFNVSIPRLVQALSEGGSAGS